MNYIFNKERSFTVFDTLRTQNNLLLGFIVIFIGFLVSELKVDYIIPYFGIIISFSISLYGFIFSTMYLSEESTDILKRAKILAGLIRNSVSFLFVSVILFSIICIENLLT